MATICLLGLGSNLGNREETLRGALAAIAAAPAARLLRQSRFYSTAPVGGPAGQGEFLNAAAVIETDLGPLALLQELHRIEAQFGRERIERWGARTLDLDLLLFGNEVIERNDLAVPHPRMTSRRFVLEPAAEIAPEMIHPLSGLSIARLFADLASGEPDLGPHQPIRLE